eukprot:8703992-Prorocentrum_lima.AAC.1
MTSSLVGSEMCIRDSSSMDGWTDDLTHAGQFSREWHKYDTLSGAYQTQDCHGAALPLPQLEPPAATILKGQGGLPPDWHIRR